MSERKRLTSNSVWTADQFELMVYLAPISVQLEMYFNLNHLFIHKQGYCDNFKVNA